MYTLLYTLRYTKVTGICIPYIYLDTPLSDKYILEGHWCTARIQFHDAHHLHRESNESMNSLFTTLYFDDDITHCVSEMKYFSPLIKPL